MINKKMLNFKYIFKPKASLLWAKTINHAFCQNKNIDTIYALSTGMNSAISIIRISGPSSYKVMKLLDCKSEVQQYTRDEVLSKFNIKPKMMKLCNMYGKDKGIIDKGMLVFFQKNHSYSGQDMFQLHLHGSKAIISAIFHQLSILNFTIAKRGEFTRRAVMNNKMGIEQAQAIHDLISSQMQFQRQIAINNVLGKNKRFIEQLRLELVKISSLVQAYIEFQQNQVGNHILDDAKQSVTKIIDRVQKILQASQRLQTAKDGIRISILGKPNVGKSTLINSLLKKNVAIVSSIPGTTRDLIQGSFILKERYKIIVVDTAGIRESTCQIQAQGIRRSKESSTQSNINLVILDISSSTIIETQTEIIIKPNQQELKLLQLTNKMIIINKIDCLTQPQKNKHIKIYINQHFKLDARYCLSFKNQINITQLLQGLGQIIQAQYNLFSSSQSQIYFTRARYIYTLQKCIENLMFFHKEIYADIASTYLQVAIKDITQIIGKIDNQEILDQIFSEFCIGK